MTDEKTRQLENRIDKLESTIEKMMPSRRDALKMGGAALVGGAAMSGTASAGTNQVGTIGSQASPVDLESEDINNADTVTTDTLDSTTVNNSGTVTTQDIVVNGTATGPFGGGGIVLESSDTITTASLDLDATSSEFVTLYNGAAKDVVGGIYLTGANPNFLYTFSDGNTVKLDGTGTSYSFAPASRGNDGAGDAYAVCFLPPAKDVVKIEVGGFPAGDADNGALAILKD